MALYGKQFSTISDVWACDCQAFQRKPIAWFSWWMWWVLLFFLFNSHRTRKFDYLVFPVICNEGTAKICWQSRKTIYKRWAPAVSITSIYFAFRCRMDTNIFFVFILSLKHKKNVHFSSYLIQNLLSGKLWIFKYRKCSSKNRTM